MNLTQKIIEVRKIVKSLQRTSSGYGYKYVSEDKVLGVIRDKMDELGLLLELSVVDSNRSTFTYKNKRQEDVVENVIEGKLEFIWVDAETETERKVPFALYGQQADASQAFGSGLTYANRYFLLKYFQIATSENDPDKVVTDKRKKHDMEASLTTKTAKEYEALELKEKTQSQWYSRYGVKDFTDLTELNAKFIINDTYRKRITKSLEQPQYLSHKKEVLEFVVSKLIADRWEDVEIYTKEDYDAIIAFIKEKLEVLSND
jgi:hypothetical protein